MTSLSEDCAKSARFLIRKAQIAARQRKWRDRCYSIAVIGGLFLFAAWFVSPGSSGAELPPALLPKKRRSEYGVDGSEQLASDPLARAAQLAELEEKSSRTLRKGNVGGGGGVGLGATVRRSRTILLGSEDGKINTGVWPGWGNGERSVLNWAAAGVEVNKYCPYQCTISHDQSLYTSADAIVLESVNHPKFGLSHLPFEWPQRYKENQRLVAKQQGTLDDDLQAPIPLPKILPAVGVFYYEPDSMYPGYTLSSEEVRRASDFSMTPSLRSTLQVTLVCPWGKAVQDYLSPPPPKTPGRLLAYFSEHGVSHGFNAIIDELFAAAGDALHAYSHKRNRDVPEEAGGDPYQLSRRLDFVGTYRFLLVTDPVEEADMLSPEWSQAFLAGTVPIYAGAPNIATYAPGARSYIDIRDFANGAELWDYLRQFDETAPDAADLGAIEDAYGQFHTWRQHASQAYNEDEAGKAFHLGTGSGVVPPEIEEERVAKALRLYPLPKVAKPDAGGGAQQQAGEEQQQQQQQEREGGNGGGAGGRLLLESGEGSDGLGFAEVSRSAWRLFRRALDHCVHYAECRMCKLVHSIT